jgi:vesicular inhibitory amino acid transporter
MNVTIEVLLGLTGSLGSAEDQLDKQGFQSTGQGRKHGTIKRTLAVAQRLVFTCLSVVVSILVPEFSSVMGVLGSFFAFCVCIIGPVTAKMTIMKKVEWYDAVLLAISICMGVLGTCASVMAAGEEQ